MKSQINVKVINEEAKLSEEYKAKLAGFLHKHLEEYGDPINDIRKSIDYALQERKSFGGYIIIAENDSEIVGVVVLNKTGMDGYIPENILVYIAVHNQQRGLGIGKLIMKKAIEITEGSIALHVEEDNPAKFLYEKVGFGKKYAEMRFIR